LAAIFALAAGAQDTGTGGTSAPANAKSSSKGASAGASSSLTGCLNGPNAENAYMLTNGRYRKGVEVGMPASDELSKHVGHKVKLTGSWAKSGEEIGENESMEKVKGAAKFKGKKQEQSEAAEK